MKTLLCLVLDRSGSMAKRESDVIGGCNKFIEDQRAVPGEAILSMARFDDVYEEFRPAKPIREVEPLRLDEYVPRGCTALLDAVGRTLGSLESAWTTYQPDQAIVVIVTDGRENASVEFTKIQIKEMITNREASGKWAFIYLGADVNAFDEAGDLGIKFSNSASYTNTTSGVRSMYAAVSTGVAGMRGECGVQGPQGAQGAQGAGLGRVIEEDEADKPAPGATS